MILFQVRREELERGREPLGEQEVVQLPSKQNFHDRKHFSPARLSSRAFKFFS